MFEVRRKSNLQGSWLQGRVASDWKHFIACMSLSACRRFPRRYLKRGVLQFCKRDAKMAQKDKNSDNTSNPKQKIGFPLPDYLRYPQYVQQ
jgi:hypothetical protein